MVRHENDPGDDLVHLAPIRSRPRWPWFVALLATIALALVSGAAGGLIVHRLDRPDAVPTVSASPTVTPSGATVIPGQALDVSRIVAKIEPSIANVHSSIRTGQVTTNGAGTGIIVTKSGEVITNAHVVNNAVAITVTFPGEAQPRSARLIGLDATADIAVLQINGSSDFLPASLATSSSARVGDDVVAIGYSLDMPGAPSVSRGIVSAVDRSFNTGSGVYTGLIQTDAAISSGNSGGALVNAYGEVIGITTFVAAPSRSTTAENLNFAIPIIKAMAIVQQIRATAAG